MYVYDRYRGCTNLHPGLSRKQGIVQIVLLLEAVQNIIKILYTPVCEPWLHGKEGPRYIDHALLKHVSPVSSF